MSSSISNLKESINCGKHDRIKQELLTLSSSPNLQISEVDAFLTLLNYENAEILKLCAEATADLTKTENNRQIFTDEKIIRALIRLMEHPNRDVAMQSLRALGNICYENEAGSVLVGEPGLEIILRLLMGDPKGYMVSVGSGFLVNLLAPCQSLQKSAVKHKALDVIEKVLVENMNVVNENEFLFMNLVTVLSFLVETLEDLESISKQLCTVLVEILKNCTSMDICPLCVDVLHAISENKEIKALIASKGICQLIYELVEKYGCKVEDEESRAVLKSACDLIVTILTEDECMDLLYNKGNGEVYHNMLSWLNSRDSDLMTTGVLAIGNFARNDEHCLQMVKSEVPSILLKLLSQHNKPEDDVKLQHALLSTLRNLAIPKQNKEKLLKEGLVDIIYPIMESEQYIVVFKLLGTLRIVIDGQEETASKLLQNVNFLTRLAHWCYTSDHLGVRGEVPRLIAWLLKNSNTTYFSTLISVDGCIRCLVEMISSNHAVMQNEAFYSLTVLSTALEYKDRMVDKYFGQLVEAEVGKHLVFTVTKYGEKMDGKTVQNMLTLLEHLVAEKELLEHLRRAGLNTELARFEKNGEVVGNLRVKLSNVRTIL